MLYERWRDVARECAGEVALRDLASRQTWTFSQLVAATESADQPQRLDGVVCLAGHGPQFIFAVLRAWRFGQALCPLEAGVPAVVVQRPPQGICLLKTTSATTGAARQVGFTEAQLAADPDNIVATMDLRRDSPNLGVISLAHSYGFSNLVLPLLLHGIPLVLAPSALPEALRHATATGGNWTLPAVPALWRAWHEADAIPANIRLAISAGAPLPLPLEQAVFERRRLKLHNFLGSTECGGISYDASDTPRADASFAGTAMRNVNLSRGEDDCLIVCGTNIGETYWPEPDERLGGGVFKTNDLVELRGSGLFLRGRASDLINVAGRKVAPEIIERVLLTHPAVRECLVLGLPSADAARGDEVVVVVALRQEASIEQLRQFLHSRLPDWQIPREWRMMESLAVNARGKQSRAEWRKAFHPSSVSNRPVQEGVAVTGEVSGGSGAGDGN